MKKRLAMLFALCLMTGVLSSCGKDTSSTEITKKDDNTLVILNYGKYIDESVLDQFEKETGIKVKLEEYESPEEMYTKFSACLLYTSPSPRDGLLSRMPSSA